MYFSRSALAEHIENEFEVIHMISQIFPFQTFQLFILARCHAKRCFRNLCGKNLVISFFLCATLLPFIGQFFTNDDASHSLFNPILVVSLELVKHPRALRCQFRVLYLLHALIPDLCEPALEWFGFRRGNGLDKTKNAFRVPTIRFLYSPWSFNAQHKGWYKLYPPFIRQLCQLLVSLFESLKILGRVM